MAVSYNSWKMPSIWVSPDAVAANDRNLGEIRVARKGARNSRNKV
jgi:hypothetical protein